MMQQPRTNKKQKVKNENIDQIRSDILRPLPRLTPRLLITLVVVAVVLAWSTAGTEANPQKFVEGVPTLVDFVVRLMPPEFEFAEGSERAIMLPSFDVREIETESKADRAGKASDDDIANLTEDQTLVYVLRLTGGSDSSIITPEEAEEYLPQAIETAETDATQNLAEGQRVYYAYQETEEESVEILSRSEAEEINAEQAFLLAPYVVDDGYELIVADDDVTVMVQRDVHTLNPYIAEAGRQIVLDDWDESVLLVDEGQRAVYTVAYEPGQMVVAKRYILQPGEILIGYPVIIDSIIETGQIAVVGTLVSILVSIPFALLAARNTTPHPIVYQVTRLFLNLVRSIPTLIYALIMVSAVGLGPFAGVLALVVGSVGGLGKLFAESFEQIDPNQVAAVRATGAGGIQVFNFAVLPQAFPLLATYALITFESNVRDSTILGIVGAGGVGFIIQKYASLFQLQRLMGAVIIIAVMVTIIDRFSDYVRKQII